MSQRRDRNAPPRALVGNAADEDQVANAEERVKDQQVTADDDTVATFSTPGGRRVYWRLLSFCGIYHSTLSQVDAAGRLDALAMAAKEGKRNVGLWLQADLIRVASDLYLTMQQEAIAAEKRTNG